MTSARCGPGGTSGRSMTWCWRPWRSSVTTHRGPQAVKAMATPPGPSSEPEVSAPAPTCFRHPDRETYVSCVRCGRPACPDCLRSAAVGQQCVDCVKEGSQSVRQPRRGLAGRVPGGAVVTWVLIGVNVVCYVAELI